MIDVESCYTGNVKKTVLLVAAIMLIIVLLTLLFLIKNSFSESTNHTTEEPIQVVADNLEIPWEIAFLPDQSMLVTERTGTLLRITSRSRHQFSISGVEHIGEGGLLGLVLHPNFETNQWLYLYLTTKTEAGLSNRVERYDFDLTQNKLSNRKVIIENIPGAKYHDGGRIAFGPDKLLYITTGDAGQSDAAQNKNSLAGKILRVTDQGRTPKDNPFDSPIFSYGHRNPQGLAWDDSGNLWITEHGPSGLESGLDEINLVNKGQNYGWPLVRGDEVGQNLVEPVIHSGVNETWAPAGLEILSKQLFFVGLKGEALYSAHVNEDQLGKLATYFKNEYGRLRIVKFSPDKKWLYLATSNTDGRGTVQTNDDKIIKVSVQLFD